MALVNSFEIIDLLSKNELGLINGGNIDQSETTLTFEISFDYDNSEKLSILESSLAL